MVGIHLCWANRVTRSSTLTPIVNNWVYRLIGIHISWYIPWLHLKGRLRHIGTCHGNLSGVWFPHYLLLFDLWCWLGPELVAWATWTRRYLHFSDLIWGLITRHVRWCGGPWSGHRWYCRRICLHYRVIGLRLSTNLALITLLSVLLLLAYTNFILCAKRNSSDHVGCELLGLLFLGLYTVNDGFDYWLFNCWRESGVRSWWFRLITVASCRSTLDRLAVFILILIFDLLICNLIGFVCLQSTDA